MNDATMPHGSSSSGIRCSTAISMTATGWLKSSVWPARDKIVPTSRRSASMNMVGPATLVSRARAWASTIGSLST